MSKQVSDVVVMTSPTRKRGNGKAAVVVLFNYTMGWFIPEYTEIRQIMDRLIDINGKEEVEKELRVKIQ
jgi:hypothetical protein